MFRAQEPYGTRFNPDMIRVWPCSNLFNEPELGGSLKGERNNGSVERKPPWSFPGELGSPFYVLNSTSGNMLSILTLSQGYSMDPASQPCSLLYRKSPFISLRGPTEQDPGWAYAGSLPLSPHLAYRKHSLTNSGRAGQP